MSLYFYDLHCTISTSHVFIRIHMWLSSTGSRWPWLGSAELGDFEPNDSSCLVSKVSSKWSWTYTSWTFSWRHTSWQSNASSISNSSHCYLIANMLLIHLAPAVFSPPLPNSGYLSPWGMSGRSSIGLTSRSALPLWHSESTVPCIETPCLAISAADKLCIGIQCLENLTGNHAGQR